MKTILTLLFLLGAAYANANAATNSIDALVQRLNSMEYSWVDSMGPYIGLSSNASPQQIVGVAAKEWSWLTKVKRFKIVEVRQVKVTYLQECSAALIETNVGRKICLFRYLQDEKEGSWWTRFFDVAEKVEPLTSANGAPRRR